MSLRDRLREVIKSPGVAAVETSGTAPASHHTDGRALQTFETSLGGAWRESANGASFVVTRRFDAAASYGGCRVGQLAERLRRASPAASLLAAKPTPPFLFFDLETTGLSGGAGTFAFIVGTGWFDARDGFVIEQHLLVDFDRERSMLQLVAQTLGRFGALVTFNGKSFDAPVLDTRYSFHRLPAPWGALPHVDVLHPSRRFWGGSDEDGCTLIALERQLLGAQRVGDVPGFEIPARYFRFIRSGDPQPLLAVLEHNRLDLLSLAGVTARLLHLVEGGVGQAVDAREVVALGRVYQRAGDDARAEEAFRHAVEGDGAKRRAGVDPLIRVEALRALALAARRRRAYQEAAARWRQLLETAQCPSNIVQEAIEALAIHHEHRIRDLTAARKFAERSLEMGWKTTRGDAARHRLARIERKLISEQRPLLASLPL